MHLCSFLLLSIVIIILCLLSLVVWDLIDFPCPLGFRCIYRKVCECWSANDWQSCSSVLKDTLFSIIRQSCSLRNRYCMEQKVVNSSVQKIFFIQKLRFPCYQGPGSLDSYQDQWASVVVI